MYVKERGRITNKEYQELTIGILIWLDDKIFTEVSTTALIHRAFIIENRIKSYEDTYNISRQTATIDLSEMVKKNVFKRIGKKIALID